MPCFTARTGFACWRRLWPAPRLTATTRIARVAEKDKAITVYYDVTFNIPGKDEPVAAGTFLLRYW